MKAVIAGVAALGIGGAAYFNTDGPDFDRVVNKSPAQVYNAFSALAREGTIRSPERSGAIDRQVAVRVTKQRNESIRYEILFDDRPVVTADLAFAPTGDGAQTRMTAELELDEYELGSAFETDAGVALSMVPEVFVDTQFANFMDDMVRDVEAGRPLPALDLNRAGVRNKETPTAAGHRRAVERQRQAASAPTGSAEPMSDPNRAARRYRNQNGVSN
jgi:hypothetical protein